jgi:hypothetical protein
MANQSGGNGRDGQHSWRAHDDQFRSVRRDEEDRYRARDDDERFERGSGSHWEDRERGYAREGERYGMGQSGYAAGRYADDRSMGTTTRNAGAWSGSQYDRGTDDRWTGRGGSWGAGARDQGGAGGRDYGQRGWEQGRMGVAPGYGYSDGDRPSFDRGGNDRNYGGLYGGGGYEPHPSPPGSREQHRYGTGGYGDGGQSGYRQHQTGLGGAQGLDVQRRGQHRGKGPQGFQRSDERIREAVCEALTDHDDVDATDIEVTVKNGEVALTGVVEDRYMKRLAEDCVERVSGVRDVHNQLRIRDGRT